MNDNLIYTESQDGLSAFFTKIYSLVGIGIGLSAFVSWLMLYPFQANLITIMNQYSWVYMGAFFVELLLVFLASNAARKNTPAALPLFLTYSALNGFTLSFIISQYVQTTVFQAFVSSALVFFIMAAIGATIKKDLSGMAKALLAALIGIIIASVVNIFIRNDSMSFIVSIASVLIFSGLIAYDNQMIKRVYQHTGGNVQDGWAISMALSLYLDFINLFLSLLRILGRND
ncbi:Bax inhibitor-1/YccA family protein [Streptococcus pluranimalium]|uniref:Inner membrane protein YbhL n=1 Tax=Streptococcus pluranimalium TaxID=82348 RepID=A0A345VI18_9STRE|nr:Bax inhibitor-1/YccA family protein [Streptococcus pluranimalium]AXJ12370.1 Inner membrane protein YbhL [Streptococcus pluranimalium]